MRTASLVFPLIAIVITGTATAQHLKAPRDARQIVSTKVPSYAIRATNLLQAAAQISSDFSLPIGVEWVGDVSAKKEIVREWHDTTLEQIVQDVAAFDVQYQLEFSNGVLHVRNRKLTGSPRNLLNIRIPSFTTENVHTRNAASQLSSQISYLIFPREEGNREACGGSSSAGAGEVRHSLSMRDASVRDILDALLVESDSAMWVVVFSNQQADSGYLTTESLWGNRTDPLHPDLNFVARFVDPITGSHRSDWEFGLRRP